LRWAVDDALPELERLVDASWRDYSEAYAAALEVERVIPDHPQLEALLSRCSVHLDVTTDPAGARVSVKNYGFPDDEWDELGTTPIEDIRLPIGIFRWKIEKPGYETVHAVASTWAILLGSGDLLSPNDFERTLDQEDAIPEGMVRVRGAKTSDGNLPDFYIDRHEVTNREFRGFLDAGGYTNPEYWKHAFVENGIVLDREQAMSRFVDRTGRHGPATWSGGMYPEGEDDHPASGISWYEAAAYAEFAGKSLPTAGHWGLARGDATTLIQFPQLGGYATFAPFSNFNGKGPVAVESLPGITSYGAYDMAGNVREWCFNESQNGRVVRGGSWSDTTYMFRKHSQAPSMDRSPQNGFRCAFYPDREQIPPQVFAKTRLEEPRDVYSAQPVTAPVFDVMKRQFTYDPSALDAQVESTQESPSGWTRERITYNAAYGDERIIGHLFLPRNAKPPYQTVVYFPGSGSLMQASSDDIEAYFEFPVFVSFLVSNGRAVLYPVYKGTFERNDPTLAAIHLGDNSRRYTGFLIQLVNDFQRSIDYLETRDDIDADRLAYYGMSWGAVLGGIVPAVEDRLRASVLVSGGAAVNSSGNRVVSFTPEADPVNYLPRVQIPTLMINGRYDMILPLEHAIQPMFDLLGTPAEDKELRLFETDHIPPRDEFIKATLDWLDRYLGPVERAN
jgi:formylglycine-generating enzyme required for sulfatase activity/pimeloyl-ACP methyl ester carboxylesterase